MKPQVLLTILLALAIPLLTAPGGCSERDALEKALDGQPVGNRYKVCENTDRTRTYIITTGAGMSGACHLVACKETNCVRASRLVPCRSRTVDDQTCSSWRKR